MTKQAWFCPACQKHHAPHVETCPTPVDLIGYPMPEIKPWPSETTPYYPEYMKSITADPCAGCKGVCGNAYCPKRVRITCASGALPVNESVSYAIGSA